MQSFKPSKYHIWCFFSQIVCRLCRYASIISEFGHMHWVFLSSLAWTCCCCKTSKINILFSTFFSLGMSQIIETLHTISIHLLWGKDKILCSCPNYRMLCIDIVCLPSCAKPHGKSDQNYVGNVWIWASWPVRLIWKMAAWYFMIYAEIMGDIKSK